MQREYIGYQPSNCRCWSVWAAKTLAGRRRAGRKEWPIMSRDLNSRSMTWLWHGCDMRHQFRHQFGCICLYKITPFFCAFLFVLLIFFYIYVRLSFAFHIYIHTNDLWTYFLSFYFICKSTLYSLSLFSEIRNSKEGFVKHSNDLAKELQLQVDINRFNFRNKTKEKNCLGDPGFASQKSVYYIEQKQRVASEKSYEICIIYTMSWNSVVLLFDFMVLKFW